MAEYALTADPHIVLRRADGANIPEDALNNDWQQYQAWLAGGGVPDPYKQPIGASKYDWGDTFAEILGRY